MPASDSASFEIYKLAEAAAVADVIPDAEGVAIGVDRVRGTKGAAQLLGNLTGGALVRHSVWQ